MKFTYIFVYSFFFVSAVVNAQFVTIPDANFRTFLKGNYPTCFNANDQMDTTCSDIINQGSIVIVDQNISNAEGIQYFDALNALICTKNNLTFLPKLPANLKILVCSKNQLKKLPSLPSNLNALICTSNKLTYLPNLPNSITELTCDSNELLSLPTLPLELTSLRCSVNELKSLPALPNKLNTLEAFSNCLNEQMINPNPSVLKSFSVYPNRLDCGIVGYLHKVSDDKYLVSYEKSNVSIDNGISLLEYRCGTGYGTAELANIAEFHKKFVDFDNYKVKNLKRIYLKANFSTQDTAVYNVTKYFKGDTLRIPKLDTVFISLDSRITDGSFPNPSWNGFCHFYLIDDNSFSPESEKWLKSDSVPKKVIRYESKPISEFLYFLPHKIEPTSTKPNTTKQLLADFKMYFKDTTFSFKYISISCTNYLIKDPGFQRRSNFTDPRADSIILKIQEGKSNLKSIKLVNAIYDENTPISERNYIVCDSVSSFESSEVVLRHTGPLSGVLSNPGDSSHYQVIAEFDTIQKPVIFQSNGTIKTSIMKQIFYGNLPGAAFYFFDKVYKDLTFSKSLTLCGNYKVKANIVGDSINCLNNSKTYTANVNQNDKSLAYVWKYNTSQSTFADFKVSFASVGTKNMELTLTSNCGTDKTIKSIQTITTPTKPSISQANNILTSSATTGNTWYKDGLLLPNETNKTLLITGTGKYKVTTKNSCGSATSNEISVILTGTEDEFSTDAIQIFPNPMTSELFIEGLQKVYLAEIIDQFGSTIISKYVSDKNTINVAGLTSGMYFLRLYDENRTLKLASKLLKN
jgi:hypothetical protein